MCSCYSQPLALTVGKPYEYLSSFIATSFQLLIVSTFLFQLLTEGLFPVHVNFTEVGAFH